MNYEFYPQLASELVKHPVVLATIVQTSGSVPGKVGAKLFVSAASQCFGTIGGGVGEAEVRAQALQVLATGANSFAEIDLSDLCGGKMRVWLERWDKKLLPLVQQILIAQNLGNSVTIVTPFDQVPYLLPESTPEPQLTSSGCFVEPISSAPTLLIIGAGQVARDLTKLAHMAGFRVIVLNDADTVQLFSDAKCVTASREVALDILAQAQARYAVLVTPSIEQDIAILQLLLPYAMRYVGMIGSRNRSQRVFQALIQQGYTPTQFQAIHTPVGLEIGAQTPVEIAISICAELIQARRGGRAKSLSEAS